MNNEARKQSTTARLFAKVKAFAQAVEAVAAPAPARVVPPAAKTGPLVPASRAKASLQLAPKTAAPVKTVAKVEEPKAEAPKATAEELSRGRQAIIEAYLNGEFPYPQMHDARFMYRVVAEEHAVQVAKLTDLKERVRFAQGPDFALMNRELMATHQLVSNLVELRQHVVDSRKAS